jgi:hypothetical protein
LLSLVSLNQGTIFVQVQKLNVNELVAKKKNYIGKKQKKNYKSNYPLTFESWNDLYIFNIFNPEWKIEQQEIEEIKSLKSNKKSK